MLFCRNSILATVLVCLCVSFRESSANYCLSSFSQTHLFPLSSSLAQERRLIGVCTHIIGNQSKPNLLSELHNFCIVHARKSRTYVGPFRGHALYTCLCLFEHPSSMYTRTYCSNHAHKSTELYSFSFIGNCFTPVLKPSLQL